MRIESKTKPGVQFFSQGSEFQERGMDTHVLMKKKIPYISRTDSFRAFENTSGLNFV